jgi:hypothetical protein
MFPQPGNVPLAPVRLGMSRTRKAQARESSFNHVIHPTWFAAAMLLCGVVSSYRVIKRRESVALFVAVGFLVAAILSSLKK